MTLFESSSTILIVIVFGIVCYKKEIFNKTQIEGFAVLLFKIIMPSYLFTVTYKNDLSELFNIDYIVAYLMTFFVLAGLVQICFLRQDSPASSGIKMLAAGYANTSIYALPIITIVLQDPTAAIIGNIVQVVIIQPLFIGYFHIINHKEKSLMKKIFAMIQTPLIIMPMIGILLNYAHISLPSPVIQSLSQIGNGASSLALFTFGLTLGATKITRKCLRFDLLSLVLSKNIIHPLIAVCLGSYMQLEPYWFKALVIAASAPTAFIVYIIAKQFSVEEDLIQKTVALSSVVSVLSLLLIVIFIQ